MINIGNFSSISWGETFEFLDGGHDPSYGHHYEYVSTYDLTLFDWSIPKNIFVPSPQKQFQIIIGNDVWIGRGCILKNTNPDKPLNIGNGAVIASDSVVVKDVPPFAIVGGNPAKFIKWRFDPEIIEALERIAWWNWDLEKIYDNFHLFKDPKEFVNKFDPQR